MVKRKHLYEIVFIFLISFNFFHLFQTLFPLEWDSPIYAADALDHRRSSILGFGRVYFTAFNRFLLWIFESSESNLSLNILAESSLILNSLTIVVIYQTLKILKFSQYKTLASLLFIISSVPIIHAAINISPDSIMYLLVSIAYFKLAKFDQGKKLRDFYFGATCLSLSIGFKEQALIFQPILLISLLRQYHLFSFKHILLATFLNISLISFPIYLFFKGENFDQKVLDFFLAGNIQKISMLQFIVVSLIMIFIMLFFKYIYPIKILRLIKKTSFHKIIFITLTFSLSIFFLFLPFFRFLQFLPTRYYFLLPFIILSFSLYFTKNFKRGVFIFMPLLFINSIALNHFHTQNINTSKSVQKVFEFISSNKKPTLYFMYTRTSLLHYLSATIPHKSDIQFSWPGLLYDSKHNKNVIKAAFLLNNRVIYHHTNDKKPKYMATWEEKENYDKVLRHFKSKPINNFLTELIPSNQP